MKAAGAGVAVPFAENREDTSGATNPKQMDTTDIDQRDFESFEFGPDRLVLGSTRVVGTDGYPTIAAAWSEAESGDAIHVHSSYDAEAAGEKFPVVLDYEQKEVVLTGGHPSGSVIDASHTDENVLEVLGRGMNDYRNNPVVKNLKIVGGDVGLRIRAAPYSSYENLVFYRNDGHGVHVQPYTDPESGRRKGTYGARFYNCQAWACGGSGFRLETEAQPHGTVFHGSTVTWCGGNHSGTPYPAVMLRGYASQWHGGTIQGNAGFGLDARKGGSQGVYSSYFEGNGRLRDYPIGIYVGQSTAFVVENSYFYGDYSTGGMFVDESPNTQAARAINFHNTQGGCVRNCSYRRYSDCFTRVQGGAHEIDVNCASHYALDTPLLSRGTSARIRDAGMIMETDLRGPDHQGQHVGDRGLHDGSGANPMGPAFWDGERWISTISGERIA